MRWSSYFLYTLRDVPSDAEVVSHQLLARAGMIDKLAAGIYTYLPLGWRSIDKLARIVREEMAAAGSVEQLLAGVRPETRRLLDDLFGANEYYVRRARPDQSS